MAEKTGRNDPCPCGSGKKYKKCCLESDEAARREAAALDGENVTDEGDDDWYGDLREPQPLVADDIISVGYASGMLKSLEHVITGEDLTAVEWRAPSIPPEILDAIEREDAWALEGGWGDPEAANPIQLETIDLETTDHDIITIEVYNRGLFLLTENDEGTRRLYRLCEVLSRTPGTPVTWGAPDHGDADGPPRGRPLPPVPQPGACALCGAVLSADESAAHLAACAPDHDGYGPHQDLVQVRVTAPDLPWYWLDVEVRASATLSTVDKFLRDTWLECCGHLSQFIIGDVDYVSVKSEDLGWERGFKRRTERAMTARVRDVLPPPGGHVEYEYDFGTTTTLNIETVGRREGGGGRYAIRLLARNAPIAWACATCGARATHVCVVCWDELASALACREHARGPHACGEPDAFLPVVNSPRMGRCGYTGG